VKNIIVGIEIGGTNTVWGHVSENGECKIVSRFKTQEFLLFEDFFQHLSSEISAFLAKKKYQLRGIGIAAPNANRNKGVIDNAANLPWKGCIRIKEKFIQKFAVNVVLDNDANAAAFGEKKATVMQKIIRILS
jgi:glucokinase